MQNNKAIRFHHTGQPVKHNISSMISSLTFPSLVPLILPFRTLVFCL